MTQVPPESFRGNYIECFHKYIEHVWNFCWPEAYHYSHLTADMESLIYLLVLLAFQNDNCKVFEVFSNISLSVGNDTASVFLCFGTIVKFGVQALLTASSTDWWVQEIFSAERKIVKQHSRPIAFFMPTRFSLSLIFADIAMFIFNTRLKTEVVPEQLAMMYRTLYIYYYLHLNSSTGHSKKKEHYMDGIRSRFCEMLLLWDCKMSYVKTFWIC